MSNCRGKIEIIFGYLQDFSTFINYFDYYKPQRPIPLGHQFLFILLCTSKYLPTILVFSKIWIFWFILISSYTLYYILQQASKKLITHAACQFCSDLFLCLHSKVSFDGNFDSTETIAWLICMWMSSGTTYHQVLKQHNIV